MGENLSFSDALTLLKGGARITNLNWNGKHQFLELQVPDEHSKMSLPYIYIRTVQGDLVPWIASQSDLLSDTWILYQEEKSDEEVEKEMDQDQQIANDIADDVKKEEEIIN